MSIPVTCSCGKEAVFAVGLAGRRVRCRDCGASTLVPAADPGATPRLPHRAGGESPKRRRRARAWWSLDRDAWVALGIGATLAAVALAFWPFWFVVRVLITVIHELGHTATAWLLASPALPTFDLTYGGGFSLVYPRHPLLVAVGCGWFAFALWRAWGDRPEQARWAVGAAVYGVVLFTPLREPLITTMGHGSELLFAGIFLYRALSGKHLLKNEERPLYAALGFFILVHDVLLAVNLITSDDFREAYRTGKGGHLGDFIRIAEHLDWSVPSVARLFLIPCALTPVVSFLCACRSRLESSSRDSIPHPNRVKTS